MAWGEIRKFGWVKQRSVYQDLEYHRARRAEIAADEQSALDSINTAMTAAQQNKLETLSKIAGQRALQRIQDAAKAKAAETAQQAGEAQRFLEDAQRRSSLVPDTSASVDKTV
jgi:hypothetical protein